MATNTEREYLGRDGAERLVAILKTSLADKASIDYVNEALANVNVSVDWNAKEGEPGHILNRTHWAEGGIVEVLAETEAFQTGDIDTFVVTENVPTLVAGEIYTVKYNGVEYDCVGQDMSAIQPGLVLLGNGVGVGASGNDEPFMLMVGEEDGIQVLMLMALDSAAAVTLSIYGDGEVVHKLDNKFIDAEWMATTQKRAGDTLFSGTADVAPGGGFLGGTPANVLIGLVPGKTYCVYINGVEYICVAKIAPGDNEGWMDTVYVGNGSDIGGEATGEPFVIADRQWSEDDVHVLIAGGVEGVESGTIPVVIKKADAIPNKMPGKFLPDGVPYYTYGMCEILPDYTITTEEEMYGLSPLNLVAGNTYTVKISGIGSYVCTAYDSDWDGSPIVYIGNASAFDGDDTGEPFVLLEVSAEIAARYGFYWIAAPVSEDIALPLTFSIWGEGYELHKLDPKLLPSSVPYKEKNILMEESEASSYHNSTVNMTVWEVLKSPVLRVGKTYTVKYNGLEYETLCQTAPAGLSDDPNAVAVGNFAAVGGTNTGEPFAILISNLYDRIDVIDLSDSSSVRVEFSETVINKLVEECLPDSVAMKSDIPTDYLKSIPSEYVTESELTAKKYVTESALTTKNYVTETTLAETVSNNISLNSIPVKLPSSESWISMVCSDDKIVATAQNSPSGTNKAAYSTDGISWTGITLPSSNNWRPVAYANGVFVAVGKHSGTVIYSTDGITWNTSNAPSEYKWYCVTSSADKFVLADYDSGKIVYSTDGNNWTETTSPVTRGIVDISYAGGKFFVHASRTYCSENLTSWTESHINTISGILYGNGKFVAIELISIGGAACKVCCSDDGVNWVETAQIPNGSGNYNPGTFADGKFTVMIPGSNKAVYSTDGVNWTEVVMPSEDNWCDVVYFDGKYVAIAGNSDKAAYSEDGINWKSDYSELVQNDVAIDLSDVGIATQSYVQTYVTNYIDESILGGAW